jgi:hypothetical protein
MVMAKKAPSIFTPMPDNRRRIRLSNVVLAALDGMVCCIVNLGLPVLGAADADAQPKKRSRDHDSGTGYFILAGRDSPLFVKPQPAPYKGNGCAVVKKPVTPFASAVRSMLCDFGTDRR